MAEEVITPEGVAAAGAAKVAALLFLPALFGRGGLPSHSRSLAAASFLARS